MGFLNAVKNKLLNRQNRDSRPEIQSAQPGTSELSPSLHKKKDNEERCLLVASQDNMFSDSAVEYALDMAKRMDYHLIALNAIELEHPVINALSSSRDQICQDMETAAEKNAAAFRTRAEKRGLSFSHIVNFSEIDQAIEAVQSQYSNIEFVVSASLEQEEEENRVFESNREEKRIEQRLCVYSMN
ncbi:MAG: hypothetical protein R6U68_02565 [Desulfobacteraceae bacterium]